MLTFLLAATMSVAEPRCPLPGEWDLDPATSDEFDGAALDKAKWWDFLPHVVGRMTYFNHGRNVRVKDGCLELWTVRETDLGKVPFQPIYRALTCDAEFLDRSSVPGETKPWKTIAWEAESTVGKRYSGWEWGPLQPDELIVEIGPKTIQTVTVPLDNAKKK